MQNLAFLVAMATTRSFYVQLPIFFACMNSGENYLEFDTTYIPFETNLNISEPPPPLFHFSLYGCTPVSRQADSQNLHDVLLSLSKSCTKTISNTNVRIFSPIKLQIDAFKHYCAIMRLYIILYIN